MLGVGVVTVLGLAFVVGVSMSPFLFKAYTVPSESMQPTLGPGAYVIVARFNPPAGPTLARPPERGDIIVYRNPRRGDVSFLSRLIGLPGDKVQMRGGALYLNGKPIARQRLSPATEVSPYGFSQEVDRFRETLPEGKTYVTYDLEPDGAKDNTEVFTVPAGHYFFMGDSRDNAQDSRYPPELGGPGYVPEANLFGKVALVVYSGKHG